MLARCFLFHVYCLLCCLPLILNAQSEHGGSELLNIAPRKPNWDLKRDVAKKMEKLNRRTQLAIVELIRERIAAEAQEGSDDGEGDESD